MDAKRMKFDDNFSCRECCACGESGSCSLDPVQGIKFQNKSFVEIIRETISIRVPSSSSICPHCKEKMKDFYIFKKSCQKFNATSILEPDVDIQEDPLSTSAAKNSSAVRVESIEQLINLNHKIYSQIQTIENKIDQMRGADLGGEGDDDTGEMSDDEDSKLFTQFTTQFHEASGPSINLSPQPPRAEQKQLLFNPMNKPAGFPENIHFSRVEDVVAFDYLLYNNANNKIFFKELIRRNISKIGDYRSFLRSSLNFFMARETQVSFTFKSLLNLNSVDILLELALEIYPNTNRDTIIKYLRNHLFNKKNYVSKKFD